MRNTDIRFSTVLLVAVCALVCTTGESYINTADAGSPGLLHACKCVLHLILHYQGPACIRAPEALIMAGFLLLGQFCVSFWEQQLPGTVSEL
jgi:hypothetical protein